MKRVMISEQDEHTTVHCWSLGGDTVEYEFDSWDEAIEALPNLPEVE